MPILFPCKLHMQEHAKTILITGGSTGIGKALAQSLGYMGHTVFIMLRDMKCKPDFPNANVHALLMDVCDDVSVEQAFKELTEIHGIRKLDVLINNAGIVVPGPLETVTEKEIAEQFQVNVFGVIRVIQKFLPLLRVAEGKIINMGSMSSRMAIPFIGLYAASKASLKQISWALVVIRIINPNKVIICKSTSTISVILKINRKYQVKMGAVKRKKSNSKCFYFRISINCFGIERQCMKKKKCCLLAILFCAKFDIPV